MYENTQGFFFSSADDICFGLQWVQLHFLALTEEKVKPQGMKNDVALSRVTQTPHSGNWTDTFITAEYMYSKYIAQNILQPLGNILFYSKNIAIWSGTAYSTRQARLFSQLTSVSESLSPIRHLGTNLVGDGRPTTE